VLELTRARLTIAKRSQPVNNHVNNHLVGSAAVTPPETSGEPSSAGQPRRLTGSVALRLHLILAAGLAVCVGAFTIEVLRALGGNTLSWLYVCEWPFFAGFGIYMWWKLLHESYGAPIRSDDGPKASEGASPAAAEEHDEALRAWNQYLAQMSDAEDRDRDRAS
jgi:hypothetical protein